jgi:hypothetical protein
LTHTNLDAELLSLIRLGAFAYVNQLPLGYQGNQKRVTEFAQIAVNKICPFQHRSYVPWHASNIGFFCLAFFASGLFEAIDSSAAGSVGALLFAVWLVSVILLMFRRNADENKRLRTALHREFVAEVGRIEIREATKRRGL